MIDNTVQKCLSTKLKAINQFLMGLYRLGANIAPFLFSLQTGARVVPCNRAVATSVNARRVSLLLPLSGSQEYSRSGKGRSGNTGTEEQLPT